MVFTFTKEVKFGFYSDTFKLYYKKIIYDLGKKVQKFQIHFYFKTFLINKKSPLHSPES